MKRIATATSEYLFVATVLAATCSNQAAAGIQDIDKTTEQGMRMRVYWIGAPLESLPPVRPGESPNVDRTVASPDFSNDDPPIVSAPDEVIDRQYLLELTGEIYAAEGGEYEWEVGSTAAVRVVMDGRTIIEPTGAPTWMTSKVDLDAGWHDIRIQQWVNEPNERFVNHRWKPPSAEEYSPVPSESLRAEAYYFRPTQPGRKSLVADGDRPGLGLKLDRVHPGYRVTNIRPGGMEMPVGGLGMLSDGRLVVARFDARTLKAPHPTEEPNGQLWLLSNVDHEGPDQVRAELIADGLFEPSGVCVVDDQIYVSQRNEVSRFDFNADEQAWEKAVVASGWRTNDFHQICAGLLFEPGDTKDHPGYLYLARSPGLGLMQNPPDHGSVWKIDLSRRAGENVTPLTGGHRTPNGIGYGPNREIFVIDNQGEWTPANELNHVQPGHFYGFYHRHNPPHAYRTPFQPDDQETGTVTQPAVILPQDEIGNSPTQPLMFPEDHQFAGQLALADMRYGGINRVFLEQIDGVWQGAVMRFTQGLEAGPNRIFFAPDGNLYAGGIGGQHASTWYWINPNGDPTYQGLERLVPTGVHVFEIVEMRTDVDGFVVSFTSPVPREFLENTSNYVVSQWTYRATRAYGGPKIDLTTLAVESASASPDRRSVTLVIPGLKEGYVLHLRTDPVSDDGEAIWSGDVWYTMNRLPGNDEYIVKVPPESMQLDPFYKKYVNANGYPIVSSERVNDYALKEAAYLIDMMLAKRPDVRQAMIDSGSRMVVMAHDEFTTDIPEQRDMEPKDFWDVRARGLGGSQSDAICSCAEENLLAFEGDPYSTENILIHEFAHNIHLRGMINIDPTFNDRLYAAYEEAMASDLWASKYAATNPEEYFAEGVQSWFNNNRQPDHDHNHVDTRVELEEYDPALAALCEEVFGDTTLVYTKPATRLYGHLDGYDPSNAPRFEWPERLQKVRDELRARAEAQTGDRRNKYVK